MAQYDPRIDDYIEKSAPFAQPILRHIRDLMHQASPLLTETMKWSVPHFEYKGPVCAMAAFKAHLGLNFWKTSLMDDPAGLFKREEKAAGSIGKITSLADLPPDDVLITYIRKGIELNEKGVKIDKKKAPAPKKDLSVPDDLIEEFKTNTAVLQHFEQFSYSAKKEYLDWLEEAKSAETRTKRLQTMLEWVAEGKTRHWKYKR